MVIAPISPSIVQPVVQPIQAFGAQAAFGSAAATAANNVTDLGNTAPTPPTGGQGVQQPTVQQMLLSALEQALFADMIGQFQQTGVFSADPALSATLTTTFQFDALLGTGLLPTGQTTPNSGVQTLGSDLAVLLSALAPPSAVGTLLNTFV